MVDSITTAEDQYPVAKAQLDEVIDSLGFSDEDYSFFKQFYGIYPKNREEIADKLMAYIRIQFQGGEGKEDGKDMFETFMPPDKANIYFVPEVTRNTYPLQFFQEHIFVNEFEPDEKATEETKKKMDIKVRNWQIKLLDYLVHCVNQGLYSTNFGLVNFFTDAKCN